MIHFRDDKIPAILELVEKYVSEIKDPFYSDTNMSVLRKSIREADEGRLTYHELIEA